MKLNWKLLRLAILLSLSGLGMGCGGISASHGVSPASLLLPGLVQNSPNQKSAEIPPLTLASGSSQASN